MCVCVYMCACVCVCVQKNCHLVLCRKYIAVILTTEFAVLYIFVIFVEQYLPGLLLFVCLQDRIREDLERFLQEESEKEKEVSPDFGNIRGLLQEYLLRNTYDNYFALLSKQKKLSTIVL